MNGSPRHRRLLWLASAWLPLVALFAALVLTAHEHTTALGALVVAVRMIAAAALLHPLVERLAERAPWPHPIRLRFLVLHVLVATTYGVVFWLLNCLIESVTRWRPVIVIGPGVVPFMIAGVWLYAVSAGVSYSRRAAARAARAEAAAAQAQLAALRAQLHPHFLFNALHTVVQLIPREPKRAVAAAERLADLLRGSLEEDRDLVTLGEEWSFVERYLEIEAIRLGDRLRLEVHLGDEARRALVPSFALQTLVENAIRHGAAPRVEPTTVTIAARVESGDLVLVVRDDGAGADPATALAERGGGLRRLRERLAVLSAGGGRLDLAGAPGMGFTATVRMPQEEP